MNEHVPINAITVALPPQTYCMQCAAQQMKEHMLKNAATVPLPPQTRCTQASPENNTTENVLHTTPRPKKNERAYSNQRGNGRTTTANVLHTMFRPREMKEHRPMNAGTVALTPQKCCIHCPARKNERAHANQRCVVLLCLAQPWAT